MNVYYNENNRKTAQRLRELIGLGLIPDGEVDSRSIVDVRASDLRGYDQCHFCAGIAGWTRALQIARWNRPCWTASLPCQPYSVAAHSHGGGKGQKDARNLLPHFLSLVEESGPAVIFGEQISAAIKWGWLDELFGPLEASGYACGASVMPAFAVRARHERKRLYWVAYASGKGREGFKNEGRGLCGLPETSVPVNDDALAQAGRILDGDFSGLLLRDGVSSVMEQQAIKEFGNAIVPELAANFIGAVSEIIFDNSSIRC